MITELKNCRVCGGDDLEIVLDMGTIFPSGFLKPGESLSDDVKAPLVLCKCSKCGLVQLKHTIDLDLMYRQYWYASSLNKSMVSSLKNIIDDVESKVNLEDDDTVVDIGCNDGTMLMMYSKNVFRVGFDPALNLSKPECLFVNDYFSSQAFLENVHTANLKAKVVTGIAMFYDLPDPVKFAKDVASILHEDGIFVVQFTDLLSMFKVNAFDNVCHEHLEYYRLEDVVNILNEANLRVIDVSYNDVNGGSVRVTATHRDGSRSTDDRVIQALVDEFNYFQSHDFVQFREMIDSTIFKVKKFLEWSHTHNYKTFLLGASTKGATLLQTCGITEKEVPFAAEVNKDKFGLRTSGSNIEIISEQEALINHPDHFIVPVWHFKLSILNNKNIQDYLNSGGKLVFPLPYFHIVSSTGEYKL